MVSTVTWDAEPIFSPWKSVLRASETHARALISARRRRYFGVFEEVIRGFDGFSD